MMKMRLIVCLTFLVLCSHTSWNSLSAQPSTDTLELAKQLRDRGKLKAAMKLLEPYHAAHPTDINPAWVYAQTAFWAKRYALSQKIYELTIWYHPDNLYLQVDYANMLVDIGKFEQAVPYLENFLVYYPENSQVKRTLARIDFWRGNYKEAYDDVSRLLATDLADKETSSLLKEIRMAKSPSISLKGSYCTDDQPLQTISPLLESTVWLHPLSTLRFSIRTPLFSQGGAWTNAIWLQAGNSSFIRKGNWTITVDAGVLKYPYKNTTTWTGNLALEKRSLRHLVATLQAQRKPYFSTGSSIDTVINENHITAAFAWDNFNSWNGQVSFNLDHFLADNNFIYALSAWGLAPPVKVSVFDFRLGYGFSYSTADENRFEPVGKKEDIIANYDPAVGIKGIYYPYFTPDHQLVNSALLAVGIHPAKGFDIGINGNLGFFARARIPYLYLDTNNAGKYIIVKDFSNQRYLPYTISAFVSWQVSEKVSIRADYRFNSTYFYSEHYAGLQLIVHLWNEKKRKH